MVFFPLLGAQQEERLYLLVITMVPVTYIYMILIRKSIDRLQMIFFPTHILDGTIKEKKLCSFQTVVVMLMVNIVAEWKIMTIVKQIYIY